MNDVGALASELSEHLLDLYPLAEGTKRSDLAALPPLVGRLAAARLDDICDRESAFAASPWIDAEHDAVKQAARAFSAAARHAARVPGEDWGGFLEASCRLAVEHVVRPADALTAFAFEGSEGALASEYIVARSRAFVPYAYLPEIAARYAERKDVRSFEKDAFALLLRRIDQRMVGGFGAEEWMSLLAPAFDVLGSIGGRTDSLPASLLIEIFEARNQAPLTESLDRDAVVSRSELFDHLTAALPALEGLGAFSDDPQAEGETEDIPAEDTDEAPVIDASAIESPAAQTSVAVEVELAPPVDDSHATPPLVDPFDESNSAVNLGAGQDAPSVADDWATDLAENNVSSETTLEADAVSPLPLDIDGARPPAEEAARVVSMADPLGKSAQPSDGAESTLPDPASSDDESDAAIHADGAQQATGHESPSAEHAPNEAARLLDDWTLPAGAPIRAPEATPVQAGTREDAAPPVIGSHYVLPSEKSGDDSEVLGPVREASTEEESDDEPLWMRLSRSAQPQEGDASEAAPTAEGGEEPAPEQEPLWKRFALGTSSRASESSTPSATGEPLEVLEARVLGLGMRSRRADFVDNLFDGSSTEYRTALDRLDACESWTQAAALINEEVFKPRTIHVFSDNAVAFTAAVETRYARSNPS